MFDSFQVSAHQLERERFYVANRTDAVAFATRHTDSYTGISRGWPASQRPAMSLRDLKLPLRTFWRVETHGLGEPKVSSRRKSATELRHAACPLRVMSRHSREDQGCPLYPQQRTCSGPAQRVSALCQ